MFGRGEPAGPLPTGDFSFFWLFVNEIHLRATAATQETAQNAGEKKV